VIILDTCAILWLAQGSDRISRDVLHRLDDEAIVAVSAISAFEVAIKYRAGKLGLPFPAEDWWKRAIAYHRLDVIHIDDTLVMRAAGLPLIHRDPADRFIIATAIEHNAPVITSDARFSRYGLTVML
jgi:PIN domain nuclease of toxin-antitoxin system